MDTLDDAIVPIGDFFVSRDYVTKTYEFDGTSQRVEALAAASTDFDLTGQVIWLVSVLVSWWVAREGQAGRLAGCTLMELGAGAGLPGLLATQFASTVLLSDYEDEVLKLLELSLPHTPPTCDTQLVNLSWGSAADHTKLLERHPAGFQLLIGADIVYWSASIGPLIDTVAATLSKPEGQFILGYFNRVDAMRVSAPG